MDKFLYAMSFLAATALVIASHVVPASAPMWLASTSFEMNVVRAVLAAMMVGLLLTNPPRAMLFRIGLGAMAIILSVLAMVPLISGSVHIVDVLLFAEAAVCFMLAAIEAQPAPAPRTVIERLPAKADTIGGYWLDGIKTVKTAATINAVVLSTLVAKYGRDQLRREPRHWPKMPHMYDGHAP